MNNPVADFRSENMVLERVAMQVEHQGEPRKVDGDHDQGAGSQPELPDQSPVASKQEKQRQGEARNHQGGGPFGQKPQGDRPVKQKEIPRPGFFLLVASDKEIERQQNEKIEGHVGDGPPGNLKMQHHPRKKEGAHQRGLPAEQAPGQEKRNGDA